jgi:hypothetical protein
MANDTTAPSWTLAEIVEVEQADRVQCQCKACGQTVYKRVHLILWSDGRIECWGSACFKRELGLVQAVHPLYGMASRGSGRRLTAEERKLLLHNRDQLVERFRREHEQRLAAAVQREAQSTRRSPGTPPAGPDPDAVLHKQAKETIEQRWRADGIDPSQPGWSGLVRSQIEEEYQRLIEQPKQVHLPRPLPRKE